MEVTMGTFPALAIQSTTQPRIDVPGVSQHPVTIAYWLHFMISKRREIPMFWKSTMALPIWAICWRPWVVIGRGPLTAPGDLLCGLSSQRTGISLQKVSTQPTKPFRVRIVSNLTLSQNYLTFGVAFHQQKESYSCAQLSQISANTVIQTRKTVLINWLNLFIHISDPIFTNSCTHPFTNSPTCSHGV